MLWVLLALALLPGCKEASDLMAFSDAKYSLEGVHDLRLNGVDVMQKQGPNDFTTAEGDSLLASISNNTLRANLTLDVLVKLQEPLENPEMTLSGMKWQLLVDQKETLEGMINDSIVLREGLNELPIETVVKMSEVEGMRNYEGLSKLMTILSQRKSLRERLTFQIKPTVLTSLGDIELPEYIPLGKSRSTVELQE